jgi:ribosomal protein S18 acetylase RimI-like enzyme
VAELGIYYKKILRRYGLERCLSRNRRRGIGSTFTRNDEKAFSNSFVTVFIYEANSLIAVGRAISDGVYQAAIYDIAVLPSYPGRKIGKLVLEEIHKELIGWMYYYFVCKSGKGRLLSTAWL